MPACIPPPLTPRPLARKHRALFCYTVNPSCHGALDFTLWTCGACVCRVQKKKLWEAVQPLLKTNGDKLATFKGLVMTSSAGPVTTATLSNASIS